MAAAPGRQRAADPVARQPLGDDAAVDGNHIVGGTDCVAIERGDALHQRDVLREIAAFGGELPRRVRCADKDISEEHTSEIKSLMRISYAVFCLKKTKQQKK